MFFNYNKITKIYLTFVILIEKSKKQYSKRTSLHKLPNKK